MVICVPNQITPSRAIKGSQRGTTKSGGITNRVIRGADNAVKVILLIVCRNIPCYPRVAYWLPGEPPSSISLKSIFYLGHSLIPRRRSVMIERCIICVWKLSKSIASLLLTF